MPIIVLLYILICYKIELPVYWYDWALFGFLEFLELFKLLFSNHIKESYEKGLKEGMTRDDYSGESLFCELDDEDL